MLYWIAKPPFKVVEFWLPFVTDSLGKVSLSSAVKAKGRSRSRLSGRSPKPLPTSITGWYVLNGWVWLPVPVLAQFTSKPNVIMASCSGAQKFPHCNSVLKGSHPDPPGCSQLAPSENVTPTVPTVGEKSVLDQLNAPT